MFDYDAYEKACKKVQKKNGSIIFLVGLTLPRYRLSQPYASLDMNLRQCLKGITPTAKNSRTVSFPYRRDWTA